ncbi:MAG: hypothetical protein ABI834_10780 [Ginsengibacter sp.]
MEDIQLQNLWKAYDEKLEDAKILNMKSLALNFESFAMLQHIKAKAKLRSLLLSKILCIVFGVLFIWIVLEILFRYYRNPYFTVSAGCIVLITSITILDYIRQIFIIADMDYSDSLVQTQQKLVFLQTSIIRSVRVSFLQLPFYGTFYITQEMIRSGGATFWIFMSIFTGAFITIALFLYKNISYKNISKGWVRSLLNGSDWKSVTKAMEFINEIEEFKKGSSQPHK